MNYFISQFATDFPNTQDIYSQNKSFWQSLIVGFFTGEPQYDEIYDESSLGKDHFLLLFKAIRGEKFPYGSLNDDECPSLNDLGIGAYSKHSYNEFMFRNRNISRQNMIFINEFNLYYDLSIYIFFFRQFIYEKVYYWYWIPYSCAQILASFTVIYIIYGFVNKQVLQPLNEMSQMTEFILNPEQNQKHSEIFHNLMEKVKLLERRYSQMQNLNNRKQIRKEQEKIVTMDHQKNQNNSEQINPQDLTMVSRDEFIYHEVKKEQRDTQKIQLKKALKKNNLSMDKLIIKNPNEVDEVESLLFIFARFFL